MALRAAQASIKAEGLDEVGRERVVREAQAMGRMGVHPHIVSILDFGDHGGVPYVVTELMGGDHPVHDRLSSRSCSGSRWTTTSSC